MRPGAHAASPVADSNGADPAQLRLQAIMGTAQSRLAIINGRVLRVGQRLGDAEILLISAEGVTYRRRHQQAVLRLPGAGTRK
jgi:MSHA biogenesis protein MshK